ncbi:MAG: trypsin-like peptidase domain-containing protein [Lachnospiraceae bacterium]|nr:trypsin-like peptidase domain-containing protein [Lachnospiraceae bacterium]
MFDNDLENENPVGSVEGTNDVQSENTQNDVVQTGNSQENTQNGADAGESAGNPAVNWTTPTPIVAENRSTQQQTTEAQTDTPVSQFSGVTERPSGTGSVESVGTDQDRKPQEAKKQKARKEKKPKEKKSGGVVKKVLVAALCGVLFGAAAGGTFYGIYQLAGGPEIIADIAKASAGNTTVVVSNTELVSADVSDDNAEDTQSTWITEVADAVMPSMVSVTNNYTETGSYFGYSYSQAAVSVGSGIIIGSNDDELLIVTNQHVIEGYDSLSVTFVDGSEVTAYLKGSDADMDLAVIAVLYEDIDSSTLEQIRIAVLGDSDELVLGQYVVAIGNALGYGQSVTNGIVTALEREVETESGSTGYFIQTNAAVNPGNSGGALLDSSGRVIGIVSAKIGGGTVEGMGFAIPINSAVDIINELSTNTTMIKLSDDEKGYLGVTVLNDSANTQSQRELYGIPEGAYVRSVEEGGGADNAGIQAGDVITAVDGNTVTGYDDLASILQYYSAGSEVTVTFERSSGGSWTEMEVTVTLGVYPTSE